MQNQDVDATNADYTTTISPANAPHAPHELIEPPSLEAAQRMLHELRTTQIELEQQSEELRSAHLSLEVARSRYNDLYDMAPVGYCTVDERGLILEANFTSANLLGVTPTALFKQPITQFIEPDDLNIYYQFRKKIVCDGCSQTCELRMLTSDGTRIELQIIGTPSQDLGGAQICNLALSDIAQRHQIEAALHERESFLQAVANSTPARLTYWTNELRCTFANKQAFTATLPTAETMLGSTPQDMLGPEMLPKYEPYIRAVLAGEDQQFENAMVKANGQVIYSWIQYIAHRVTGKMQGFFSLATDITALRLGQEQLREREQQLQLFIEHAPVALAMFDREMRYLQVSDRWRQDYQLGDRNLIGVSHYEVFPEISAAWKDIYRRGLAGEVVRTEEDYFEPTNGTAQWLRWEVRPWYDVANAVGGVVIYSEDISARKATDDKIQHLAFYDALTGLPNRRMLLDRLNHLLATGSRHRRPGALLFIDLDNFKTLNDTYGHDQGDLLLQQVAQRLLTCIRKSDSLARWGGDEFVVLLEDLSDLTPEAAAQAQAVAEKILAALGQPYSLSGETHHGTPSIGITLFDDDHETVDALLKHADLAMYQAKAAGRNTLRFFDPQTPRAGTARSQLENDLRGALAHNQFQLFYQPQVAAEDQLTGVEALLRWQHPQRGMVSPADFISIAEDNGLILPLGRWVLDTACAQLVAWATQPALAQLPIAVNISPRQFHQADFVAQVLAALTSSGANPQRLKLELTEGLLVTNVEDVIAKMTALKTEGVGFSLDDFGTGYSSLAYLKRLPLDQLKIDQSFVRDILTDPNDAAIANTIIALGQTLGLAVIAEGVETTAQRDFLVSHGSAAYQGYLFSRPLPIEQLEELALQAS